MFRNNLDPSDVYADSGSGLYGGVLWRKPTGTLATHKIVNFYWVVCWVALAFSADERFWQRSYGPLRSEIEPFG